MGRHREFCVDTVLDAVVGVFWRKGYEGATYTDLTEAAGVERPALYAAFGNKEALFHRALERYAARNLTFFQEALQLPTAREVVARILYGSADLHTRYKDRAGCLGITGSVAGSDEAEPVRRALAEFRAGGEAQLRNRLEQARADGDLPQTADPDTLSAFVMAVTHGMAVQAKAGFSRAKLRAVAGQALSAWPMGRSTASKGRARR